jgi:hypothetical protein
LGEFIAQAVGRTLKIDLNVIPSPAPEQKGTSLIALAENGDFSALYLRKLATQGKIEAWKEGRNWLSKTEAIAD